MVATPQNHPLNSPRVLWQAYTQANKQPGEVAGVT